MATRKPTVPAGRSTEVLPYRQLLQTVVRLIESGRIAAGRAVNQTITATYWLVGRQIVEHEQHGTRRAGYGEQLITKLSKELIVRFGRGFSQRNLEQMRAFYLWKAIPQTPSAELMAPDLPLPWSHYSRLLAVRDENARAYYEREAVRGGWSVRQLDRHGAAHYWLPSPSFVVGNNHFWHDCGQGFTMNEARVIATDHTIQRSTAASTPRSGV